MTFLAALLGTWAGWSLPGWVVLSIMAFLVLSFFWE